MLGIDNRQYGCTIGVTVGTGRQSQATTHKGGDMFYTYFMGGEYTSNAYATRAEAEANMPTGGGIIYLLYPPNDVIDSSSHYAYGCDYAAGIRD